MLNCVQTGLVLRDIKSRFFILFFGFINNISCCRGKTGLAEKGYRVYVNAELIFRLRILNICG